MYAVTLLRIDCYFFLGGGEGAGKERRDRSAAKKGTVDTLNEKHVS